MSGRRGASSYREGAEQALFASRMALDPRTRDLPWSATMTGVNLGIRAASIRKAQGVRRGVPDFLLFQRVVSPSTGITLMNGLALEFKSPDGKGRLGDEQGWWHDRLRENGWKVLVVTDAQTAWAVVADYLGFKP